MQFFDLMNKYDNIMTRIMENYNFKAYYGISYWKIHFSGLFINIYNENQKRILVF